MSVNACMLGLLAALPGAPSKPDVLAIRVGAAETVSQGKIEHAVILIENGVIEVVGQDLALERGIRVLDRPGWTAIPGLVHCHSRLGFDGRSGGGSDPQQLASGELYPRQDVYRELLEAGVTTLGLMPPGNGIPGQSVAIRPRGDSAAAMILRDRSYLKIFLYSNSGSKKMLRDGFEGVDKYLDKEKKAFEKWQKDVEKAKEKEKEKKKKDEEKKSASDDTKKEEKADEGPGDYVPSAAEDKLRPFMELREGTLTALIEIRRAGDWLQLQDAIGKETFTYGLRLPLRDDVDLFFVAEEIGKKELTVVVEPAITLMPATRRERNLPAELARAGARVAFVPSDDQVGAVRSWLSEVGVVIRAGLARDVALRALTLEPAKVLRVDDKVGSIEPGKLANLVFFDGDPFEPSSRIQAVMLEGEFVVGPDREPIWKSVPESGNKENE